MNDRIFLKIAWLFAIIGIGLLLASAYFYRADTRLESNGATAEGNVIAFREGVGYRNPTAPGRDDDPNNRFNYRYPVIRFTTMDGQPVRLTALRHYELDDLGLGDRVDIVYLRESPDRAEIRGTRRLSEGMRVTGIIGMACLLPLLLGVLLPALLKQRRIGRGSPRL